MSDGPHRTLPMSARWRALAERADKLVYHLNEVGEVLGPALKSDWAENECEDLMRAVRSFVGTDRQASIFDREKIAELETLRRDMAGGHPLRRLVLDHIIYALSNGGFGIDGVCEGIKAALRARCARGRYQVEEHYVRESTETRASKVGQRLDDALSHCDLKSLARELSGQGPVSTPARPPQHKGLDDGVAL